MVAEKSREVRLRRMARRQDLELHKSGLRDPFALGFGRYVLVDGRGATIAGEHDGHPAFTLEDVERYLTTPRSER